MSRIKVLARAVLILSIFAVVTIGAPASAPAQGIGLPPGFAESVVATDIQTPVGMEVAPDGRIFVLGGNVRRIEIYDDDGFVNRFLSLPQAASLGSGLTGLEFAPDFATSGDVYVAYLTNTTVVEGPQRFRLSRFSSDGTTADPASEVILFEVDDVSPGQQLHQGGDVNFGGDGKLYWTLGDRVKGAATSQSMDSLFGKVLRLNTDGSIPTDNPFYDTHVGDLRAIFNWGLRNPYRMARQESTGDLFMSEVGHEDWEEINRVEAEANYGWPMVAGAANNPLYVDPIYTYHRVVDDVQVGCAITGGTFYEPVVDQFPASYRDHFFYGDHCFGWIDVVDLASGTNTRFMTGAHRMIEMKVNPQTGSLYYLDREYAGDDSGRKGGIGRIDFIGDEIPLAITRQPGDVVASINETVLFDVLVTGESPFTYQWYRDDVALAGETAAALTVPAVQASDDGAMFHVVVGDANFDMMQSRDATLTVEANTAPVPVITAPDTALRYVAGQEYTFAGSATDAEDGDLDPASLSWEVVFHHDEHTHPFIPDLAGVAVGSFVPPVNDETAPNVWYRIHLTATDSDGTSTTVSHDVLPLHVQISLETNPAGLAVLLDGTPVTTPHTFTAVAGVEREVEAAGSQTLAGQSYDFVAWSDGGAPQHTLPTPTTDLTLVATYEPRSDSAPSAAIDLPVVDTTVPSPAIISGTATDDLGVKRVQIAIKQDGTTRYWDGVDFVEGWRTSDAVIANPGATSTTWSFNFSPPRDTAVKIIAVPRDTSGQSGTRSTVEAIVLAGAPPVAPVITLDSPSHQADASNPVTFSGSVIDDDLVRVAVVIKQRGARIYWNGADWQADRVEVTADVADSVWSYDVVQTAVSDLVVFARAVDATGLKDKTEKVTVFVD